MRGSRKRFLSRGPGFPALDDAALLSLVPVGEAVAFERVRMLLTEILLCELSAWVWVTLGDCNWPVLGEYRAAAELEIRGAIARNVLTLSDVQVEYTGASPLARLRAGLGSVLACCRHGARKRLPVASKVEQEADAILHALHF